MADQRNSSSVDDILEALKQGQNTPAAPGSVDDILADLGLEQEKAQPAQQPAVHTPRTTQSFWQEPEPEPEPASRKKRETKQRTPAANRPARQAAAKAAPPPQQEEPVAPRLSDTIQMDSDFQKFFSESVAVIPDLEQEQHPGFFARFVGRKKNAQTQEDEESQEDYATALDAEEDEEEEEPEREEAKPRRRFGFWHKWNSDEADEEEEVQEDEEPEQEPDEAPAPARGAARLFHRQRPVQPPEEEASGTVELPALDAASHRSTPTVDRAPTRPISQPAAPVRPQPVGTVKLEVNEAPAAEKKPAAPVRQQPEGAVKLEVNEAPAVEEEPAAPTRQQPVGTVELEGNEAPAVELPLSESPTVENEPVKQAVKQPAAGPAVDDAPTKTAPEPAGRKAAAAPEQRDEGATQRTVVLRPEELELEEHPTGSVQLDVDWGDEPGPDATRVIEKDEAGGAPRLLGDEAPGAPFEEEPAPEYVEDYENPADAPLVQQDLDRLRLTTAIRTGVSAVAGLVLLYLGLAVGDSPLPAIAAVDPAVAPLAYLAVNLVLLVVVCAVNWRVFWNGIRGLWGAPTPDSVLALAGVGALAQLLVLMMNAEAFEADKITLFAAPAALLLCFGALGKYLMSGVISRNFALVSTGSEHVAAFRLEDEELCTHLAEGLGEPEPCLVASRPTTLVEGFLRRSFSVRASDRTLQRMSWVLAGAALFTALIALFSKQGLAMAFTAFAGTLCLGGPASATLLAAVPGMLMQKSAARVGAVVPGWSSIEELSGANMIVVGAKDLFPAKSVRLHGIKTFEKERIDLAILYAASVLIAGCDTLRDVFMNIIQGKTNILFPVESLENDPGFGFTAWVKDKRVIIGNRAMMEKQGVEIPSLDYENRYTKGKKQPIYLAVSGRLFGMFLVSYKADEQAAHVLESLNRQGVSVLVKSDDFSLTTSLISQIYGLEEGSVKVLSGAERHALAPVTEYQQYSPGCMAHIGSFASFVGGLLAAAGAASAERTSSLVQAAGILVSVVLAVLLAFTGGMAALALPALVLYQAAWAVLTLMIPMLKRYE
ncbi:hypothetical protein [Allofournierella massiliensis]|uniref:hypothetical protein n=1 Tax=Allofournierella massiliensis TaxID=1650663 RepID=UPI0024B15EE6|nr:hypothetical protein [Fournierella massiliensis]